MPAFERAESLVSVICPVKNGAKTLGRALTSVARQSYSNWELLVIDDGSDDETSTIALAFAEQCQQSVIVIGTSGLGPSAARNRGIALARGQLVAFIDADDYWLPQKLGVQVVNMQHSQLSACTSAYLIGRLESPAGLRTVEFDWSMHSLKLWLALETDGAALCSTLLIRTDSLKACGGFSEDLRVAEDLDLAFRLFRTLSVATVKVPLTVVVESDNQSHKSLPNLIEGHRTVLAELDPVLGRAWVKRCEVNINCYAAIRSAQLGDAKSAVAALGAAVGRSAFGCFRYFWRSIVRLQIRSRNSLGVSLRKG